LDLFINIKIQLRNIGIINSTTRLHLVGSFYEIYITMHGSMEHQVDKTMCHIRLCQTMNSKPDCKWYN